MDSKSMYLSMGIREDVYAFGDLGGIGRAF